MSRIILVKTLNMTFLKDISYTLPRLDMRMEVEYPQEVIFSIFDNPLLIRNHMSAEDKSFDSLSLSWKQVSLEAGHPAVFSANGSHGVWAQDGINFFLKMFRGKI